jgi:hypothetical protein
MADESIRARPSVHQLRELNNNVNKKNEVPIGVAIVRYREQKKQIAESRTFHHTRSCFAHANVEKRIGDYIHAHFEEMGKTYKHIDRCVEKSMCIKRREDAAAYRTQRTYRTKGPVLITHDDKLPTKPPSVNGWINNSRGEQTENDENYGKIPAKSLRSKPPPFKAVELEKTTWYTPEPLREQLPATERLYQIQTCASLERMRVMRTDMQLKSTRQLGRTMVEDEGRKYFM